MARLNRKEHTIIIIVIILCAAIAGFVIWLFTQLEHIGGQNAPVFTASPTAMVTERFTVTEGVSGGSETPPKETEKVIIPQTDGPVYYGVASSIHVDCVDISFTRNEVIDRLFYLDIQESAYTVTESQGITKIRIGIETEKAKFETLYTELLTTIYNGNVTRHLENGQAVDQKELDIEGKYSYLTIYLYPQAQRT